MDKYKQFEKNFGIINHEEFMLLQDSKVIVIGLGGLGGNFVCNLVRLGVNNLLLIDFDKFDISNLNRQVFSNHENINKYKADVISLELIKINPFVNLKIIKDKIQNVDINILNEYDYIIDCVDNLETKKFIFSIAKALNKPVLHGACAGWYGQIGWLMPDCSLIDTIYQEYDYGLEKDLYNPSFTPGVIANMMISEFLKLVVDDDTVIKNELLLIDLYNNTLLKTGKG